MPALGIDFGTSNSSVALFDQGRLRLLPVDAHARDPRVMRSVLYVTREGGVFTGQRALDLYGEQNTGREVKFEKRWLGEIELTYSDMKLIRGMYAEVDANEPGRLFQSMKRFLADTSFVATDVFGSRYTLEELLSLLARRIVDAAEAALGEKVGSVVVGRPVRFSGDAKKDRLARERLAVAWRMSGVRDVVFLEEPVAAVHHYASEASLAGGEHVLVFDFGGGTLDITVTEARGGSLEVLATAGVPLGGDLLDSRIMQAKVAQGFGELARYRRTGLPMPIHLFDRLKTWQTLIGLNRPDLLELIRRARRDSDDPEALAAFETLVTRNYGFELFRAIEEAKIELSAFEASLVLLERDGLRVEQELTRAEFEAVISGQVGQARQCVLDAVSAAGREPEQVDVVVTTGGSSLIPAFRRMLSQTLARARLHESDTFTSVAAGLAIWGAR
jgi:hypothetical chaperone protein